MKTFTKEELERRKIFLEELIKTLLRHHTSGDSELQDQIRSIEADLEFINLILQKPSNIDLTTAERLRLAMTRFKGLDSYSIGNTDKPARSSAAWPIIVLVLLFWVVIGTVIFTIF